jgi:hypothetical protein
MQVRFSVSSFILWVVVEHSCHTANIWAYKTGTELAHYTKMVPYSSIFVKLFMMKIFFLAKQDRCILVNCSNKKRKTLNNLINVHKLDCFKCTINFWCMSEIVWQQKFSILEYAFCDLTKEYMKLYYFGKFSSLRQRISHLQNHD